MLKSTLFVLIFSFFIATIIGPFFIPFLHRLKFGQAIREEGPQSHRKKSGTPTMGGISFIVGLCPDRIKSSRHRTDFLIFFSTTLLS